MLRELQALGLVVRADAIAVELARPRQHLLIDQAADGLAVLEDERHLARAHLEHGARTPPAGPRIAEARIEEAGVVHPELADQGIERHHLGGVVGRHLHRLLGRPYIELVGIEDQVAVLARRHRLPELPDLVAGPALDVDHAGVALGAIADEPALARQIDADRDGGADVGVGAVDQALARVELGESYGIEQSLAAAETNLREPRALAHQDRKGARADLGIERAVIAVLDLIETARAIGDDPGEDIEPTGRALRIGG